MKQWEYTTVYVNDADFRISEKLNVYGSDGWECLCHWHGREIWDHVFVMKREKKTAPDTDQ